MTTVSAAPLPTKLKSSKVSKKSDVPPPPPPSSTTTASTPVVVGVATTHTAAVPKKRGGGVKKPAAPASTTTATLAVATNPTRPPRRRVAVVPISPRTVNTRLNAKGEDALSYRDVRVMTDALAKNVSRALNLAFVIGKKGSAVYNGKAYTKSDMKELTQTLTKSVRQVPTACRQSSHKAPVALPEPEREGRYLALLKESSDGISELATHLKLPALMVPLNASEEARIRDNKFPSKLGAGAQIAAPFYISDALRRFIQNADLGNGIACLFPGMPEHVRSVSGARDPVAAVKAVQDHLGFDPLKELGMTLEQAKVLADPRRVLTPLVIERGIATSPILMSVMAAYIVANKLKDPATGRIKVDDHMRKYLGGATTTRWVFGGTDYTPTDAAACVSQSGLARLEARAPKKEGDPVPCDGKSFIRSMSITLASMYRIAKPPAAYVDALKHPGILKLANGVKAFF